jgi:hypothetical protein
MAKITTFVISMLVFIAVLVGALTGFMAELNDKYHPNDYNNSRIEAYNKLSDISTSSNEIKSSASNISSKSGVLDVVGGFFESAYNGMKISANSVGIFNSMQNQAIEDSKIPNADVFKAIFSIIVILIIFLGIIISTAVRRDL